jgi:hypothetical protein
MLLNPASFTPYVLGNNPSIKDPNLDCYGFFRPYPYQVNYDSKLSFQQFPYFYNFSNPYPSTYAAKTLHFPTFPNENININPSQSPHSSK